MQTEKVQKGILVTSSDLVEFNVPVMVWLSLCVAVKLWERLVHAMYERTVAADILCCTHQESASSGPLGNLSDAQLDFYVSRLQCRGIHTKGM